MADLQRSETRGDVVKRHQPDDAAAWQSFVAKVDKPVTTKPVKRKVAKKSRKQAKKLWRFVSTPKFPFVRVKIHDLIDDSATSGYS